MKYETKIFYYIIFDVVLLFCLVLFPACQSVRSGNNETTQIISDNQRTFGRIENAIDDFNREVENVRIQSETITDRIERIIYEFDEYELCVIRLCDTMRQLQNEIRSGTKQDD